MDSGSTSNNNGTILPSHFIISYTDWIQQEQLDLDDLTNVLATSPDDASLRAVVGRVLDHFQDYLDRRSDHALFDGPSMFCQSWCNTFERSVLWMGGCRPTKYIRLVYAVCGMETAESLQEYLRGVRNGNLGELNCYQLNNINTLQLKTIKDEDALYGRMASLQESIADEPLMKIVKYAERVGVWTDEVKRVMDTHAATMANLFKESDKLRMDTLRDLLAILTPFQAVDLLISYKKLQISLYLWGKIRDQILHGTAVIPNTTTTN